MCCMLTTLVMAGPRLAIIIWWLFATTRFNQAFSAIIWPILGIIFAPWTTLMYLIVWSPATGVYGFDWLWIGLAVLADIGMYVGGGYGNRERIPGYGA